MDFIKTLPERLIESRVATGNRECRWRYITRISILNRGRITATSGSATSNDDGFLYTTRIAFNEVAISHLDYLAERSCLSFLFEISMRLPMRFMNSLTTRLIILFQLSSNKHVFYMHLNERL